jgi:predicted nucleic acid-binding protein
MVKLYIEKTERDVVEAVVQAAETVVTSTVTWAGACATFARALREGRIQEDAHQRMLDALARDWPRFTALSVVDSLSRHAGTLARLHALRGFDAIHLASALYADKTVGDVRFLAFDARLMAAARNAGLAHAEP